jgi:uncharacterized membrane protein
VASATPEGVVLAGHVAAGFVALAAGLGALATEKGGRRHRGFGRAFVYAMTVVAATALVLYPFDPSFFRLFLALVAVFSYYFVFTGYRVLSRKRPSEGPGAVDWAAVGLLTAVGVGLVAMGGIAFANGSGFGTVMATFGAIAVVFGVLDLRTFRSDGGDPGGWVSDHLVRMCGAYVAAASAFSAVNFTFLPPVVRWLWPTVVGVPAIALLARRHDSGGPAGTAAA